MVSAEKFGTNESNVKHLSGKVSKHFVFKLNADGKVEDGDKFTAFTAINSLFFGVLIHH